METVYIETTIVSYLVARPSRDLVVAGHQFQPMNEDPIVEEVRRVREKLARRFNYDIHAIFADLRARERREDSAHPLVRDASAWVEADENALALREQPKRQISHGTESDS